MTRVYYQTNGNEQTYKRDRKDPGNYRPISLTSVICKLLESFIRDHIIQYMEENNLFNTNQHEFRKGRSCITQLLEVFDHWSNVIGNGNSIDVIYLDFKKAFDTVSHNTLFIKKMEAYKINKKNIK